VLAFVSEQSDQRKRVFIMSKKYKLNLVFATVCFYLAGCGGVSNEPLNNSALDSPPNSITQKAVSSVTSLSFTSGSPTGSLGAISGTAQVSFSGSAQTVNYYVYDSTWSQVVTYRSQVAVVGAAPTGTVTATLDNLKVGAYFLVIETSDGAKRISAPVTVLGGVTNLSFQPNSPTTTANSVSVAVTANYSKSSDYVDFILYDDHWNQLAKPSARVLMQGTIPNGTASYTFTGLVPGAYNLVVQNEGYTNTLNKQIVIAGVAPLDCPAVSLAYLPGRTDKRLQFNFEAALSASPGSEVFSNCVTLTNLGTLTSVATVGDVKVSVNQGPWISGPIAVSNGSKVKLKAVASVNPGERLERSLFFNFNQATFGGEFVADFVVFTANAGRPAQVFKVGPNQQYKQIRELTNLLAAGDLVLIDSGNYLPFVIRKSGTRTLPITYRGVGATRPVIAGSLNEPYTDGSTVTGSTIEIHKVQNVILENLEVTGGTEACIRNSGDQILIKNLFVRDCPEHGILGMDNYSGSLTIDRTEVARVGSNTTAFVKHAIYVPTDRDRFPDAVFRLQNSFVHDFRGNGVKSRSNKNEIYYNWIETPDDRAAFYALQLNGYQEYTVERALNSDVVGNILINKNPFAYDSGGTAPTSVFIKFGDGTGDSKGRHRFINNTLVVPDDNFYWGLDSFLFRIQGAVESIYIQNNAVFRFNGTTYSGTVFKVDEAVWTTGQQQISGRNNSFPIGSKLGAIPASNFNNTTYNNTGVINLSPTAFNFALTTGSPLLNAGQINFTLPSAYVVPNSLQSLEFKVLATRPISGQYLNSINRPAGTTISIGAQ
jgi:hypothetical protein